MYNGSGHDQTTTAYSVTNESSGTGYTAAGPALSSATQTTDNTNHVSFYDFADVTISNSSITATDCLIYSDTVTTPTANVSLYVGDFGGSRTTSSGDFVLTMPAATFGAAIIRFA